MFLEPLLKSEGQFTVRVVRTGRALATTIEPAFDSKSRNRGLLGRDHLSDRAALVLAPCSVIHTFGMAFPIDVVFADRQGRVVKLSPGVVPRRIRGAWKAFAVIELVRGTIERVGLERGDRLVVEASTDL